MKHRYTEKNVNKVIELCNEWCCPCNEGMGCQGNIFCRNACEQAATDEKSEWNALMEKAFATLYTPEYDSVCKAIYEFAERI